MWHCLEFKVSVFCAIYNVRNDLRTQIGIGIVDNYRKHAFWLEC